ncbi:MAG: hypothetical protein AAGH64_07205 [Planctomycetota bacterium]
MTRYARTLIAALLLALAPPHALAHADETVADLRRENDQLRERIAQLEAMMETVIDRNNELEAETDDLRDRLLELTRRVQDTSDAVAQQRTRTDDSLRPIEIEPPELAPATDDPMASPGQLLAALARDHDGRYPELTLATPEDRERYTEDLRKWERSVERDFNARVDWLIDVVDDYPVLDEEGEPTDARTIVFYVIDRESNLPFDADPSTLTVASRAAIRTLTNDEGVARFRVNGVLTATPIINTARPERGMIDSPPYIAPYVEFAYAFRVNALFPDPETR